MGAVISKKGKDTCLKVKNPFSQRFEPSKRVKAPFGEYAITNTKIVL